ncbi:MAG: hypothetical protein ACD_81C00146G0006 [uncultured bacterium]|uniref:Uncharacterized protein n=2 Tax=Candidatus Wolfeibacteriota TaxID=1752735 RepID=A0A0G1JGX1_9BACT|nr:MAG: hypothetical protein ACD_81C00146G0006 [uncultured bacterium]KKR12349.1 MAG: hypothetical protein UT41_C0002G0123 [Candidatus Wolfebacteria bacterium GW2011_GWC2_39_22]KKT43257.1 MAG: hypothetical protein UW32_C0002G0118 [Candidatus Wolfebacteria bacterium GW2011_GWE2_44_13]HBI25976.1 hypothetical protein [Candidatus Wolfebacteria bacterium]
MIKKKTPTIPVLLVGSRVLAEMYRELLEVHSIQADWVRSDLTAFSMLEIEGEYDIIVVDGSAICGDFLVFIERLYEEVPPWTWVVGSTQINDDTRTQLVQMIVEDLAARGKVMP